jgi:predicted transcriptional regulator
MNTEQTEPTSVRLPISLIKHIEELAKKRKWSRNTYIVNALIKYSNFKDGDK